jgi:putative phosphoribosyl transferase
MAIGADFDLVISRKLPLPMSPEGGFGSITDDGTIILDDVIIKHLGLTKPQMALQINKVRGNIRKRSQLYHDGRSPVSLEGRTVVIVDDGLASGYTMKAAIASIRKNNPGKIIAAVPVGPEHVVNEIKKLADKVVACVIGKDKEIYVSDYYRNWYEVSDSEVLACLKEFSMRRGGGMIKFPAKKNK